MFPDRCLSQIFYEEFSRYQCIACWNIILIKIPGIKLHRKSTWFAHHSVAFKIDARRSIYSGKVVDRILVTRSIDVMTGIMLIDQPKQYLNVAVYFIIWRLSVVGVSIVPYLSLCILGSSTVYSSASAWAFVWLRCLFISV